MRLRDFAKPLCVSIGVIVVMVLVMGMFTETRRMGWRPVRTDVTADDTALDGYTAGLTYQFTDKSTLAIRLNPEDNYGELIFYGTDAADETCNYKVYVWRVNGPARLFTSGVVTLGTALRSAGVYYADTITQTDYYGDATVLDSAANRVCTLSLSHLKGSAWLYVEIDIPATAQVASLSCEFTGY